ncbi:MAG: hypothetical protein [Caudoviricetes sp.]|nr:MAG: hypothetical protein [Caudoviricetes sp.]
MKMPNVEPISSGAVDEHSYISLTDFEKLQERVEGLFPKSWIDYSPVSTYIFGHRETGINIAVTNEEAGARFNFSIFRLPQKLNVGKYHLVRYQFLSLGVLRRNCWVSLTNNCPNCMSFDYTVAVDAIQAYLCHKMGSKE